VLPAGHVERIGGVQGAVAHEPTQHARAHLLLHGGDIVNAECRRVALQEVPQPLGDRQHPLAHRQYREDLLHQMRRQRIEAWILKEARIDFDPAKTAPAGLRVVTGRAV